MRRKECKEVSEEQINMRDDARSDDETGGDVEPSSRPSDETTSNTTAQNSEAQEDAPDASTSARGAAPHVDAQPPRLDRGRLLAYAIIWIAILAWISYRMAVGA